MRASAFLGAMLLMAAALTTACGGANESGATSMFEGSQGKGESAPDFELVTYQGAEVLGGEKLRFSDLLSQRKPIVLNFWAGACPPCREEMPQLDEVARAYQDGLLVFGLDVGPFTGLGSREDGRALLGDLGVTFPAGTTYDTDVVHSYEVMGMPTTFFITSEGDIYRKWTGLLTKDKLRELVEELVTASS